MPNIKIKTLHIFFKLILFTVILNASDLLKVKNKEILDNQNQPVFLNGCNLGNWLILEMWMLDYAGRGIHDQKHFIEILENRFGLIKTNKLMEVYRNNWITEKDIDIIKSFGMNTLRLPFDYKILMDSDLKPFKLKKDAWKWIDYTLELARERDMYVILDMHGAPGRQSGMDHSGEVDYNKLWDSKLYQEQTVWLWRQISERYKNDKTIAAYDLLNEPWGSSEKNLKNIILRIYKEIRKNNDEHIIIFPGHRSGIDFYKNIRSTKLENIIYTMHFYPGLFGGGPPTIYTHTDFIQNTIPAWVEKMNQFNSPLLIGEFNVVFKSAGGGEMMRRYFDIYSSNHWPATMWSYKVFKTNGGVEKSNWGMVTNKEKLNKVDIISATYQEIENWFKYFGSLDYAIDEDLRFWMTTEKSPKPLDSLPPRPPKILSPPGTSDLPALWHSKDIGRPLKGGEVMSGDTLILYGGGNDIWTNKDQFRFVYQKLKADFEISVKVNELLYTHSYAKAGIMVRSGLKQNSAHGMINIFPGGNTEFGFREKSGDQMKANSGPDLDWNNVKLKVTKKDDSLNFFVFNNDDWIKQGELNIENWGETLFVGVVALSHDDSQLTIAKYSDIFISKNE